jgi:hypothetical protein
VAEQPKSLTLPNLLNLRDPELVRRLRDFRRHVHDLLLDLLAGAPPKDMPFRSDQQPHALEEVIATAQVLRVLGKETWRQADMEILERFWRPAWQSDLFADEFEADRHRIQHQIESAKDQFLSGRRSLF